MQDGHEAHAVSCYVIKMQKMLISKHRIFNSRDRPKL